MEITLGISVYRQCLEFEHLHALNAGLYYISMQKWIDAHSVKDFKLCLVLLSYPEVYHNPQSQYQYLMIFKYGGLSISECLLECLKHFMTRGCLIIVLWTSLTQITRGREISFNESAEEKSKDEAWIYVSIKFVLQALMRRV